MADSNVVVRQRLSVYKVVITLKGFYSPQVLDDTSLQNNAPSYSSFFDHHQQNLNPSITLPLQWCIFCGDECKICHCSFAPSFVQTIHVSKGHPLTPPHKVNKWRYVHNLLWNNLSQCTLHISDLHLCCNILARSLVIAILVFFYI